MRFPWLLLFRLALIAWSRLRPAEVDARCAAVLTEWEQHQARAGGGWRVRVEHHQTRAGAPGAGPSAGYRVRLLLPRLSIVGWLWVAFFGWFLYSLGHLVWFVWSRA